MGYVCCTVSTHTVHVCKLFSYDSSWLAHVPWQPPPSSQPLLPPGLLSTAFSLLPRPSASIPGVQEPPCKASIIHLMQLNTNVDFNLSTRAIQIHKHRSEISCLFSSAHLCCAAITRSELSALLTLPISSLTYGAQTVMACAVLPTLLLKKHEFEWHAILSDPSATRQLLLQAMVYVWQHGLLSCKSNCTVTILLKCHLESRISLSQSQPGVELRHTRVGVCQCLLSSRQACGQHTHLEQCQP